MKQTVSMDTQEQLRRAAECLLQSVQSEDQNERAVKLKVAQAWLQRSKRTRCRNNLRDRAA